MTDAADTFLSRILRTSILALIPEVIVVTGAEPAAVRAAWHGRDRRVRFLENPQWSTGQLSTLLAGLRADSPVPVEAVLVFLVDAPLASAQTVQTLVAEWRRTRRAIVRPARGDEHGHPVLIDAALFGELAAADPHAGAKAVLRAHEMEILNVPSDDAGAFLDFDTPEQYERWRTARSRSR